MTAFFETRTPARYADRVVALYFEDDLVALNTYYRPKRGFLTDGAEVMLDRSQVDGLISALQTMRTMIDIQHPQPAIEAGAVAE